MRYLILSLFISGCMLGKHHVKDLPEDTTSELPDCAGPSYPCGEHKAYLTSKHESIAEGEKETQ